MRKSSSLTGAEVLLDVIARKAIPSIEQGGMQRVVVARKSWRDVQLPPSVHISHKKLLSRRSGAHGPRLYGNASGPTAKWAQDDQEETRAALLVCVTAGQADIQIGNYILHCPEGTFILIPPGVPHPGGLRSHIERENCEDCICDLLWFSAQGRHVQCWTCYSRGDKHECSKGDENVFPLNSQLIHFMDFMHEEALARRASYEKLFETSLRLFLMTVHREIKEGRFLPLGGDAGDGPAPASNYDPIERAQEYIRVHLAGTLTIDKVAQIVHMSRTQFTHRFHQQTGQTFVEYVNARRVEQAQIFLRETDWSVEQISKFVGIRSVAYFHDLFRRLVETTPVEFRRRSLEAGMKA